MSRSECIERTEMWQRFSPTSDEIKRDFGSVCLPSTPWKRRRRRLGVRTIDWLAGWMDGRMLDRCGGHTNRQGRPGRKAAGCCGWQSEFKTQNGIHKNNSFKRAHTHTHTDTFPHWATKKLVRCCCCHCCRRRRSFERCVYVRLSFRTKNVERQRDTVGRSLLFVRHCCCCCRCYCCWFSHNLSPLST